MPRPGGVLLLLLLLTSAAAAVQYRWLDPVSLHEPAVQTIPAGSEISCGLRCEGMTDEECSGFVYEPGAGTCRLFSGDCRGPAVNSSQQTTYRYMARSECPGEKTKMCASAVAMLVTIIVLIASGNVRAIRRNGNVSRTWFSIS